MAGKKHQMHPWYRLDNAGLMYSSLQQEHYSAIYRFSAMMTQPVDRAALQRAIDKTMPRFPTFSVRMRRGLFWYYFEQNTSPGPFLKEDISEPCQPIRYNEDHGWLIRFYAYEHRISIECFHALTDGAGALTFFRTLLAVYLRELGVDVPFGEGILDITERPDPEELEDAYARYASGWRMPRRPARQPEAYQNIGTPEPFYTFHVTMGFVPLDLLHAKAKSRGASLTEYLAAALIYVLLEKQRREAPYRKLPVALAVPINLRGLFPSRTLRNFITTVRPSIDPALGEYSFAEIVAQVHHHLRLHVTRQEQRAVIAGNVKFQTNRFLQLVPVFLKNPVILLNYRLHGTRPYSATFTNPGSFQVPAAMRPHIRHMEVILGQATIPRPHCASISYGNVMEITFAGTQKETDTERDFFRFLVEEGIPVKIESNRSE